MARARQTAIMTILFVTLTVGSLGLVAATVDSVSAYERGQGGQTAEQVRPDGGDRFGVSVSGEGAGDSNAQQQLSLVFCVPALQRPAAVLGVLLALSGAGYLTYRGTNAATAGMLSAGLLPVVMLVYFLLTNCGSGGGGTGGLLSGTGVLRNTGGLQAPTLPPALVGVVFLGITAVAGVLLVTGSDEPAVTDDGDDDSDEPDRTAFARAAGEAADRIEEANADVDNAVYRAWIRMTGLLDVDDPETTPPREFAQAAIEAGLDSDDVTALTELFTEVRYGEKSAQDREKRAIAALRNIEATYRDSSAASGGDDR